MAFNLAAVIGTGTQFAASFLDGYAVPGTYSANPDGSYTLLSIGGPSVEDSNTGFPSVLAPNNLGLPGSPAFVNGDTPGALLTTYTGPKPVSPYEITLALDDNPGFTPYVAGELGFVVVAYNPSAGFLIEQLNGFDSKFGGGTLSGDYTYVSTSTALNTLDASANPITPATTFPVQLAPVTASFAVPEPSMTVAIGVAFLAVMAVRAVRRGQV